MAEKQPVRDERWIDAEGNEWQVADVAKWQPTTRRDKRGRARPVGEYRIEFVVMRNAHDERRKVRYADLVSSWKPALTEGDRRMGDPLDGRRAAIVQAIRAGRSKLTFQGECPVKEGELYHLACGEITIGKMATKVNKRSERVVEVEFTRRIEEPARFLRMTVPGANPKEIVKPPTTDDIRRATIDGNYLTGAPDRGGDPLAVVPLDWVDKGLEEREAKRLTDRRSVKAEEETRRQMKAIKAQMTSVCVGMVRQGLDPAPFLDRVVEQLRDAQKEFDRAA
jgi:hypothetical protein